MCDGQQTTNPYLSSCTSRGCRPQQARLALSRAQGRLVQNAAAQGPAHPLSCRVSVSRADISAHDAPVSD